ncbi:hypothetical protein CYMTET_17807 [Cymbomonas tetramitiformis]|uniref:Uncharacterized protein n=1 Tax=Cymbomonas tetramitiformis TaxID=36881 RepID=A0AAE0G963_9CHLO|nr:hypothetical protein CYMTET_17807 [Cymbomonas tetramitiformis]
MNIYTRDVLANFLLMALLTVPPLTTAAARNERAAEALIVSEKALESRKLLYTTDKLRAAQRERHGRSQERRKREAASIFETESVGQTATFRGGSSDNSAEGEAGSPTSAAEGRRASLFNELPDEIVLRITSASEVEKEAAEAEEFVKARASREISERLVEIGRELNRIDKEIENIGLEI